MCAFFTKQSGSGFVREKSALDGGRGSNPQPLRADTAVALATGETLNILPSESENESQSMYLFP